MKNKFRLYRAILLIAAIVVSTSVFPQQLAFAQSTGSIDGYIYSTDEQDNQIGMNSGYVCASLNGIGEAAGFGCSTPDNGFYHIEGLPPGDYAVWWDGDARYARMAYPHNVLYWTAETVPVATETLHLDPMLLEPGGTIVAEVRDAHTNGIVREPGYIASIDGINYSEFKGNENGIIRLTSLPLNHEILLRVWGGSGDFCDDPSWAGPTLCYDHQWYAGKTSQADATPIILTDTSPFSAPFFLEPLTGAIQGVVSPPDFNGFICAAVIPYEIKGCGGPNGDGTYTIKSLPAGDYMVWFGGDPRYAQMTYLHNEYFWPDFPGTEYLPVTTGNTTWAPDVMELEQAGTIDLTAVDAVTGIPLKYVKYLIFIDDNLFAEWVGSGVQTAKIILNHEIKIAAGCGLEPVCEEIIYLEGWSPLITLTPEMPNQAYEFSLYPEVPTPEGTNVTVNPSSTIPVKITFDTVVTAGNSAVPELDPDQNPIPTGFELIGKIYDVYTDAVYSGTVDVCFTYDDTGMSEGEESLLELRHYEGGLWVNVTSPGYPDIETNVICGAVSSLSPFAVMKSPHPPSLGSISVSKSLLPIGSEVSVQAGFTDDGQNDTYLAKWDWGDGSISDGEVAATEVSGNHIYSNPGVYTLTLILTDGAGSKDQASYQYIVVYDPTGGFVTGGGTINSPTGAYPASPALIGSANFGFVARYQKGANVPTGHTEFQFRLADLNFKSTSYDWLVVAGSKAQFKGEGTVNGTAGYKFILTALDAGLNQNDALVIDSFRIKIWNAETGVVFYDNQLAASEDSDAATSLSGGSIVIHK